MIYKIKWGDGLRKDWPLRNWWWKNVLKSVWSHDNISTKFCVYFNCLVTCKTCYTPYTHTHWTMRTHQMFNRESRESNFFFVMNIWENFIHSKMAPVQCVTSTDKCWAVNLWLNFTLFMWWFSIVRTWYIRVTSQCFILLSNVNTYKRSVIAWQHSAIYGKHTDILT